MTAMDDSTGTDFAGTDFAGTDFAGVDFWARMERRGPAEVVVDGRPVREGSRVRLRPSRVGSQADIMDLVLDGRVAVVESIEQDEEGVFHFAVTLDDDPGRDLGEARLPGHRFFYSAEEIEPVGARDEAERVARVLVAGVGNIFLGDDGFGVEVVRRLAESGQAAGAGAHVDVVDFGIRGMDLAYALQRDYDLVILVDAAARGQAPGTITVLEPDLPGSDHGGTPGNAPGGMLGGVPVEGHGMDPVRVLRLAAELGRVPERVVVVCCEPAAVLTGGPDEDVLVELSEPVRAAVGPAVRLVMDMIAESAGPGSRPENAG
ncbi:hydrogenase maturation protease [Nonomuraea sp. LPB2021202275-12-8]|uniref:hydrogenase maturation protease n=1 Tax=Nonomuraea sp. LPB2021202275-12-8 TaxID=3120159 RepID=UPI00300C5A97